MDVKTCKQLCYAIIAPFDVEDDWRAQELKVMLDTYDVYQLAVGIISEVMLCMQGFLSDVYTLRWML